MRSNCALLTARLTSRCVGVPEGQTVELREGTYPGRGYKRGESAGWALYLRPQSLSTYALCSSLTAEPNPCSIHCPCQRPNPSIALAEPPAPLIALAKMPAPCLNAAAAHQLRLPKRLPSPNNSPTADVLGCEDCSGSGDSQRGGSSCTHHKMASITRSD